MKLMKKFKSGLIGLSLIIPVAFVAGVVASCGQEETPTFNTFKTAAEAESAVNIVTQTKIADWKYLPSDDLTKGDSQVVGQTVVVSITSKSKNQTTVFVATYVKDSAYNLSAWKCPDGPKDTISWAKFKKNVISWANGDIQQILATVKYFQAHPDSKIPFNATWAAAILAGSKKDNHNQWVAKPTINKLVSNSVMYYTISLASSDTDKAILVTLDISITYNSTKDPTFANSNCKMIKFNVAPDPWSKNAQAFLLKANSYATSKNKLLQYLYVKTNRLTDPVLRNFLLYQGDPVRNRWPKLKVVLATFNFIPATNPPLSDNKFGQETFTMTFYASSDTTNSKPLTSGGAFYMNRFSKNSHIIDNGYLWCGTKTDIKKL